VTFAARKLPVLSQHIHVQREHVHGELS